MDPLSERYQAMPDEQLLKALAQPYKYHPDAIAAAQAEAINRGVNLEDIKVEDPYEERPQKPWVNKLSNSLDLGVGRKESADILDWMPTKVEASAEGNKLINLAMVAIGLLMVLDIYGSWSVYAGFYFSYLYVFVSLFSVVVVPAFCIAGLWKRAKFGYYAAAGLVILTLIGAIGQAWTMIAFSGDDFGYIYGNSYWGTIIAVVCSTIFSIGLGWALTRSAVYGAFSLDRTGMILGFVWGSLGLMLVYGALFFGVTAVGI